MNAQIRKNTVKLESFGFKINELYLRDIILTNSLFCQLNDEDISDVIDKKRIIEKNKNLTLFSKGESAEGIYVVTQGIIREEYNETQSGTVNLGTIIGINVLVDDDSLYDTTVVCESRCTLIYIAIHQMQRYSNNYSDFESTIYENYFLHKIHFLPEYPQLVEVN